MDSEKVIRITKLKHNKGKTKLEWHEKKDNGWDEFSLVCNEPPTGDFLRALQNLDRHVSEICEFPESYDGGITPIGVSFSFSNDVMGATISALKTLKYSTSPLLINTPHKPVQPYSGDDYGGCLDADTVDALNLLIDEAKRYIAGERAQQELDVEGGQQAEYPEEDGQQFLNEMG